VSAGAPRNRAPAALPLAWRLLRRDLASGEIRVLLAALVLAVAAVTTIGFVTDRAERALALEANRLLGGDAVLRADEPIGEAPRRRAGAPGLAATEVLSFRSMARAGGEFKLSEIRALGTGFPLRGEFTLVDPVTGDERRAEGIPAPGTAWITRAGAEALGARVGDALELGLSRFTVAALVSREPDAALDYFNVAPRIFIPLSDLPATGLDQEGARITYRLVVAGEPAAVERFVRESRADLGRGQRLETIEDARPEVRRALERADRFLGLSALVSVILAAVAVAMAARRHTQRHLDGCAVMRCLGASQGLIARIHVGEMAILGLVAATVGIVAGLALQALIGAVLTRALGVDIPPPGLMPALEGYAVGFAVLAGFAVPPVLALRRVPALRVLRRDVPVAEPSAWLVGGAGLAGVAAIVVWKAGSATLGAVVLGGIAATLLALAALALGLIAALRSLRARLRGAWRYGLANVGRRRAASVAQVAAIGLGLMAILLLTLVRTDLISRWQDELPADAPNRFIINVQPDQLEAVRAFLVEAGIPNPGLYPMVRGRLTHVNDVAVTGETYAARGERARRLAEREFNLSGTDALADDNVVVAGRFWAPGTARADEVSVEEGIARTLGWSLGDRLTFDVAGEPYAATITSLRRVTWESFRPNFFVVGQPAAIEALPRSYITSVHVAEDRRAAMNELVRRFPNLSVIDIEATLEQVQSTADQVAKAVEYVFWFTLAAGLLVLVATVTATQDERLLEGGVMRVLGANRRQLRLAQLAEFAVLGLIAGLVAAIAANAIAGAIATRVFEMNWLPDWRVAAVGALVGIIAVTLTGLAATRRVVTTPPSQTLRAIAG
jgi:putative ABC transport system permease protein